MEYVMSADRQTAKSQIEPSRELENRRNRSRLNDLPKVACCANGVMIT
jgi:hypothetical protein